MISLGVGHYLKAAYACIGASMVPNCVLILAWFWNQDQNLCQKTLECFLDKYIFNSNAEIKSLDFKGSPVILGTHMNHGMNDMQHILHPA